MNSDSGLRGLMEHVGIDTAGRDIAVDGHVVDAADTTDALIAQLRTDLAKTARERDDAEARLARTQEIAREAQDTKQDMRTQWLTAIGALRETDARNAELISENKELRAHIAVWAKGDTA